MAGRSESEGEARETEVGGMQCEQGARAKGCGPSAEDGKGKGMGPALKPAERSGPTDTLTVA